MESISATHSYFLKKDSHFSDNSTACHPEAKPNCTQPQLLRVSSATPATMFLEFSCTIVRSTNHTKYKKNTLQSP